MTISDEKTLNYFFYPTVQCVIDNLQFLLESLSRLVASTRAAVRRKLAFIIDTI